MISIVAKWSILPGKHKAAVTALQDLACRVQREEPFVPMYTIHIPNFQAASFPIPSDANVVFFSVFDDEAAFQKHLQGPVFRDWLALHKDLFLFNSGNLFVVSEMIDRIAGYVRPSMVTTTPNCP
jgi:quinol monooxygenase YgiN